MSGANVQSAARRVRDRITVRVDLAGRGVWEVALPGRTTRLRCATLEEAKILAAHYASRRAPCELIVCDAYHRVLHRELLGDR